MHAQYQQVGVRHGPCMCVCAVSADSVCGVCMCTVNACAECVYVVCVQGIEHGCIVLLPEVLEQVAKEVLSGKF